jgi:hypothetical protein
MLDKYSETYKMHDTYCIKITIRFNTEALFPEIIFFFSIGKIQNFHEKQIFLHGIKCVRYETVIVQHYCLIECIKCILLGKYQQSYGNSYSGLVWTKQLHANFHTASWNAYQKICYVI